MQYKGKMLVKVKNIIILIIFLINICFVFAENSYKLLSSKKQGVIKSRVVNNKNYISLANLSQSLLPGSVLINNYSIEINKTKIKVYPGSFYMLIENEEISVYQFTYPVIKIDNQILLPFDECLVYLDQIKLLKFNKYNSTISLIEEAVKPSKQIFAKKVEDDNVISIYKTLQNKNKDKNKKKLDEKEIMLETYDEDLPLKQNEEKNFEIKSNDELKQSVNEISPIIDETFDLLLNDGSTEIRSLLKNKSDSTNETFDPGNYRLPKKLKRKNVIEK